MDTFSLDKNVSIGGVRNEKYPKSKQRMWSPLSRGSAAEKLQLIIELLLVQS